MMPRPIVFELCAETLDACLAAETAGADRVELCSCLQDDGLTPSTELLREALKLCSLPMHVMLRPRGGNFVYTAAEFDRICEQLEAVRGLGADGFVCGILQPNHIVDIERMRVLTKMAGPLPMTFHRAFDRTTDLSTALEDVVAAGCSRVLTSGGAPTSVAGATALAGLVAQAGDRIQVAVGGGLRLENAAELARTTGAAHFHGTVRMPGTDLVDTEHLRAVISALKSA